MYCSENKIVIWAVVHFKHCLNSWLTSANLVCLRPSARTNLLGVKVISGKGSLNFVRKDYFFIFPFDGHVIKGYFKIQNEKLTTERHNIILFVWGRVWVPRSHNAMRPDTGVLISGIDNQPGTSSISGHFTPLKKLKFSLSTCPKFVL